MSRSGMMSRQAPKEEESKDKPAPERKAGGPPVFTRSGAKPAQKPAESSGSGQASFGGFRSNVASSKPQE